MNRLLADEHIASYEAQLGRETVKTAVNATLEAARRSKDAPPFDSLRDAIVLRLACERYEGLVPVVNATGILLHTNLGRAPLSAKALDAMRAIGAGYSNLEYDLRHGTRGSRYSRASGLLREITGAQDALVVNNCAAAVLLIVDTFAKGREVIVSRGELVEIGGGFRIPEVLEHGSARLVEVGTTNKTSLEDYRRALSPQTALLLRTHASNFCVSGFTSGVAPQALAALGHSAGIPAVEDLGSGALTGLRAYGLPHERTVQEALADGMDLVAFSADKVLGGPQAGIIVGSQTLIARLRNNALIRALRADKFTFAALIETLRSYADPQRRSEIPFFAMLEATIGELHERAQRYAAVLPGLRVIESVAYAGGGTLPQAAIASLAVVPVLHSDASASSAMLRTPPDNGVPVVARIENGTLLLDLRTILPEQDAGVIAALRALER